MVVREVAAFVALRAIPAKHYIKETSIELLLVTKRAGLEPTLDDFDDRGFTY